MASDISHVDTVARLVVDTLRIATAQPVSMDHSTDLVAVWVNNSAKVLQSLFWPLLVFIVVLLFRHQLESLIDRLRRLGKGGAEFDTGKREAPPSPPTDRDPSDILDDIRGKIMATLWKYQREISKDDPRKRWTFTLFPPASEYLLFTQAIQDLVVSGLVWPNTSNGQYMLSEEGLKFCNTNSEKLGKLKVFTFN